MSRDWLREAGDRVESAAEQTNDEAASERLRGLAEQLDSLADRSRGPDHGRLDRLLNALGEVKASASDEVGERIDEAREKILDYRETVEGV